MGVYATTAYGVSRRRREMNIRAALGARASQVFALVAAPERDARCSRHRGRLRRRARDRQPSSPACCSRCGRRDPFVLAAVVALVGAVGVLASATAARQGMRVDPAAALRDE